MGIPITHEMALKIAGPILILAVTVAVLILVGRLFSRFQNWIGTRGKGYFKPVRLLSHEIVGAEHITGVILGLLRGARGVVFIGIVLAALRILITFFPEIEHHWLFSVIENIILALVVSILFYVVMKGLLLFFRWTVEKVHEVKETILHDIQFGQIQLISKERSAGMMVSFLKFLRLILVVVGFFAYFIVVFSFFGVTRTWSGTLLTYLLIPVKSVFHSIVAFLPNVFYIGVISVVAVYAIKLARFIFMEIEKETISLPGFFNEWATPTFKLVRFIIIFFALIVIFPYLPGSDSPGFKGLSVFLGILLSLGSSSAISNIIAGIAITYMRPFKINDRVKIDDADGMVIEKTLLVTRIRTVKNIDITIPNSMILGNHIINYSSSTGERGLIIHTAVTIGYDAPWRKVHELLYSAARGTANIRENPEPFILQKSLDDFFVTYELNAYTDAPDIMERTYSLLHQNIQDTFNEAGVEIMSPHYNSIRDGNKITIPDSFHAGNNG